MIAELEKIAVAHGYRKTERVTMEYIAQMIIRQFPRLNANEVMDAFELAACGKTEVKHSGELTARHTGEIIQKYLAHRRQKNIDDRKATPIDAPPLGYNHPREMYDGLVAWIAANGAPPVYWDWTAAYAYAKANGLITETAEQLDVLRRKSDQEWERQERKTNHKNLVAVLATGEGRDLFFKKTYLTIKLTGKF